MVEEQLTNVDPELIEEVEGVEGASNGIRSVNAFG